MKVLLEPGSYVVAVSGGVDSVALLHHLQQVPELRLVVAHFDHGIRPSSAEDREFVETLAKNYKLSFEFAEGNLGPATSEAAGRQARYGFLERIMKTRQADAIVTAHHQDDVLETAIINMLRGTGRRGLSSLADSQSIRRPLLDVTKQEIIQYARRHKLEWREDESNQDQEYLRNYVRHRLLPRFDPAARDKLLKIVRDTKQTNQELDSLIVGQLSSPETLDRQWFSQLPHDAAREVMAVWLREQDIRNFDKRTIERLVIAAKTGRPDSKVDVIGGIKVQIKHGSLALYRGERWKKTPSGV